MQLVPQFKTLVEWDALTGGRPQIRKLHAFPDGSAILLVGDFVKAEGVLRHWWIRVTQDGATAQWISAEVEARFAQLTAEQDEDGRWSPRSFTFGDGVGLLLSDQWVYLWEDIHAEPLGIRIANPFARAKSYRSSEPLSFDPTVCGAALDGKVPVIFRHPDESYDYACFASVLDIDIGQRTARWLSQTKKGHPVPVIYRPPPKVNQVPSTVGTYLHDIAFDRSRLDGGRLDRNTLLAWSIGSVNRPTYHGMGVDYAALLGCGLDGKDVSAIREEMESLYGNFLSSADRVLVTPMFKSVRKGKQSLLDVATGQAIDFDLPRGYAGYRIFDGAGGLLWAVSDVQWLQYDWHATKEGKPTFVAAFAASGPPQT